jgi:hypothetical protein
VTRKKKDVIDVFRKGKERTTTSTVNWGYGQRIFASENAGRQSMKWRKKRVKKRNSKPWRWVVQKKGKEKRQRLSMRRDRLFRAVVLI